MNFACNIVRTNTPFWNSPTYKNVADYIRRQWKILLVFYLTNFIVGEFKMLLRRKKMHLALCQQKKLPLLNCVLARPLKSFPYWIRT